MSTTTQVVENIRFYIVQENAKIELAKKRKTEYLYRLIQAQEANAQEKEEYATLATEEFKMQKRIFVWTLHDRRSD